MLQEQSLNTLWDMFKTLLPFSSQMESGGGHVSCSCPGSLLLLGPPALAYHWHHVEEMPFSSAHGPTTWPQHVFKPREKATLSATAFPGLSLPSIPKEVGQVGPCLRRK